MNSTLNTTQNKRLIAIMIGATALLALPLIAMRFTDEVNWTTLDFAAMGTLLFGTGLLIEFTMRKVKKTGHRLLIFGVILFALLVIWAELAVGVFGTPFAGN